MRCRAFIFLDRIFDIKFPSTDSGAFSDRISEIQLSLDGASARFPSTLRHVSSTLNVQSKYDMYSMSKVKVNLEKVKPYYQSLIEKVQHYICIIFSGLRSAVLVVCVVCCGSVWCVDADGVVGANVFIDGKSSIASTDESFICATMDWWPREKCDYGTCSWDHSSLLNLVSLSCVCVMLTSGSGVLEL